MTCILTDELRTTTKAAFQQYGGQAEAAKELGVARQYVWAILNGERENDEVLLKLADFIDRRITAKSQLNEQKKQKTAILKMAIAL
jgi:transcriptional regulator with XRE-family HTH domain